MRIVVSLYIMALIVLLLVFYQTLLSQRLERNERCVTDALRHISMKRLAQVLHNWMRYTGKSRRIKVSSVTRLDQNENLCGLVLLGCPSLILSYLILGSSL